VEEPLERLAGKNALPKADLFSDNSHADLNVFWIQGLLER
jgi:hypothetical protein